MPDWTDEDDACIQELYPQGGADPCRARLSHHSRNSIQHRASTLRLTTPKASSDERWDTDEDRVIQEHYPDAGSDLEDMLPGRTRRAIKERARRLGIAYTGPPRGLRQFE